MVLPLARRLKVMEMEHDSIYSGHLRFRKTLDRIRLSFFWPSIRHDVELNCLSCKKCQIKARSRVSRVSTYHAYRTCSITVSYLEYGCYRTCKRQRTISIHAYGCRCTRWPWVFLLKSLSAKVVCEAQLNLFSQVGISSVIISDNGTNFTRQLTQQFMKLLGCSPRYSTPYHLQGSGLVERFNSTFKSMLHHVIRDHPGTWHKQVPLLVWSLREMPNATTGLTPYQMVYGRLPKGILSLLKIFGPAKSSCRLICRKLLTNT